MKELVNPYWSDLDTDYPLFLGEAISPVYGIYIVENEHSNYNLIGKVQKLDEIIDDVIGKLNKITFENKDNLIDTIKIKKNTLANIISKYEEMVKNFKEIDKIYRVELFEFYKAKYENASFFAFSERNKYLSIMNDIQLLIKKGYDSFIYDYYQLRNSFFEINKYIIKVKILFQI